MAADPTRDLENNIEKFSGEHFVLWKYQMKAMFQRKSSTALWMVWRPWKLPRAQKLNGGDEIALPCSYYAESWIGST